MILLSCLLAFCLLPSISSKAGEVSVQQSPAGSEVISSHKKDQIAHGNAETDTDLNVIKHFVDDLVMIAPVLFPAGKSFDFSQIPSALFGDGQTQIGLSSKDTTKNEINEMPIWARELAEAKNEMESDANGKPWANLLHKLQHQMADAMSSLDGAEDEQYAKSQKMKTDLTEAVKELARLVQISGDKIVRRLENGQGIDQKGMLKELAQHWNEIKVQVEKEGQNSDWSKENEQRTERMLQLIINLPIDGVDGLANAKKAKKEKSGRRHRKRLFDTDKKSVIALYIIILLSVFVLSYYIGTLCFKKEKSGEGLPTSSAQH